MEFNILSGVSQKSLDLNKTWDSVIIGGGPASYNAALYMIRKGYHPLLIVGNRGGQLALTSEIENYLGFDEISGDDLVEKFHNHVRGFSEDILESVFVEKMTKEGDLFKLSLSNYETVVAKTVIMATGGEHRKLNVKGEDRLDARGISYCAICDAPFFKDKNVIVVGGGDSAVEAAIDLSKWAKHVHIVHRSVFRAAQILMDRMNAIENITYELGSVLEEIGGDNRVSYVQVYNKDKDTTVKMDVEGVFIEIGQDPRVELVEGWVALNDQNEIIVDRTQATSVEGLFAAGDVTDAPYKQVITATAEGAVAGLSASDYIMKLKEN